MTVNIHNTAIVDPSAELGNDVEIGPWAIVGPRCVVGEGSVIGPRASLERDVTLGKRVRIGSGSIIGGDPQDLKYVGESTTVEIGDDTTIREFATINRGTSHSHVTRIGKSCFIMSYVHIAHDCNLGNGVMISNGTQLAGHVTVDDRANISGLCAVHQFVHIGRYAFIGGCSRVAQDVPPYVKAVGNPVKLFGLNSVGLQRHGFQDSVVRELKRAYRLLFRSEHNVSQGLQIARDECDDLPEVSAFLDFVEKSERGVGF